MEHLFGGQVFPGGKLGCERFQHGGILRCRAKGTN
jgi:hypothetical protein